MRVSRCTGWRPRQPVPRYSTERRPGADVARAVPRPRGRGAPQRGRRHSTAQPSRCRDADARIVVNAGGYCKCRNGRTIPRFATAVRRRNRGGSWGSGRAESWVSRGDGRSARRWRPLESGAGRHAQSAWDAPAATVRVVLVPRSPEFRGAHRPGGRNPESAPRRAALPRRRPARRDGLRGRAGAATPPSTAPRGCPPPANRGCAPRAVPPFRGGLPGRRDRDQGDAGDEPPSAEAAPPRALPATAASASVSAG